MVSNILTWVNENHARLVGCRPGAYRVLRHDGKEFCPNLLADAPLGSFVVYCHMHGSEMALLVQCRILICMYGACMQVVTVRPCCHCRVGCAGEVMLRYAICTVHELVGLSLKKLPDSADV